MSNNQFIHVRPTTDGKWSVWIRDTDTGAGHPFGEYNTKLEAVEGAQLAELEEQTEYGITITDSPPQEVEE